jgi:hypothetical protein
MDERIKENKDSTKERGKERKLIGSKVLHYNGRAQSHGFDGNPQLIGLTHLTSLIKRKNLGKTKHQYARFASNLIPFWGIIPPHISRTAVPTLLPTETTNKNRKNKACRVSVNGGHKRNI